MVGEVSCDLAPGSSHLSSPQLSGRVDLISAVTQGGMFEVGGIYKQENICQQTAWTREMRGTFRTKRPMASREAGELYSLGFWLPHSHLPVLDLLDPLKTPAMVLGMGLS